MEEDFRPQEIQKRLNAFLAKILKDQNYFIEDPIDLYYLTGLKLSKGLLILGKMPVLCVDGRYTSAAKALFPGRVASLEDEENILSESGRKILCFDCDKTSYARYEILKKHTKNGLVLKAVHHPTKEMREIKSFWELEILEKSASINQQALKKAFSFLKEGVTEKEVATKFMTAALELGAEKMAFDPIIAFGEHTALAHHRASSRKLKKQDPVLMDVGIVFQGYASDITRTCFFGESTGELLELRNKVISLQKRIVEKVKPGVMTSDLAAYAKSEIEKMGPYKMVHSLGHGLGLEVHEFPRISTKIPEQEILKPGMVITIEPGVYIEGLGGFREEDTLLITENGFKNFYKNFEFATVKF